MKPLALRTSLSLYYTGALALLLSVLGISYYRVLSITLDRDSSDSLREITDGMHGYLRFEDAMPVLDYDQNDPDQVAFIEASARYYQVYDAKTGALLLQSPAMEPLGLRYTPAEIQEFREHPREIDIDTDRGRYRLSNTLLTPSADQLALLQIAMPLASMDGALDRFLQLLLWSIPVGIVAAGITGRWMAGRALSPLARLASEARAIRVNTLGQRLPVRGAGDELDRVAVSFNDTLGRLEQAVGEMRQFSTALAHELRTPLAALRGQTELALMNTQSVDEAHRVFGGQLEELDRLARLISQMLTLARAEAGEIPLQWATVDLSGLAETAVEQLETVAQARAVSLVCQAPEQVNVRGDAGWLERLLLNLVDNAIKFTPAGGRIDVSVTREAGVARLDVTDTGIGIPAEAIPHVFDRFYRADPARSSESEGTGLGLTLAKWIADRHQATITVKSQPGHGSTFTVLIPQG